MKTCKHCEKEVYAKGVCKKHYEQIRRKGFIYETNWARRSPACTVEGCENLQKAKGYCDRHYQQIRDFGEIKGDPSKTKFSPNEIVTKRNTGVIVLRGENTEETGRAIIDRADIENVKGKKWHLTTVGYAATDGGKTKLANYLLGVKTDKKTVIDHINRNKLDNRRKNLRTCTKGINAINSKLRVDNTSGYRGVSWDKSKGNWFAHIGVNGENVYIGRYKTKIEAIRAYREARKKYYP